MRGWKEEAILTQMRILAMNQMIVGTLAIDKTHVVVRPKLERVHRYSKYYCLPSSSSKIEMRVDSQSTVFLVETSVVLNETHEGN